jgi:hypothetical protein
MTGSDHRPCTAWLRLNVSRNPRAPPKQPMRRLKMTLSELRYVSKSAGSLMEMGLSGRLGSMYLKKAVGSVVVHFPLAMDDPWSDGAHRLASALEEGLKGGREKSVLDPVHEQPLVGDNPVVICKATVAGYPNYAVVRLRDRKGEEVRRGGTAQIEAFFLICFLRLSRPCRQLCHARRGVSRRVSHRYPP